MQINLKYLGLIFIGSETIYTYHLIPNCTWIGVDHLDRKFAERSASNGIILNYILSDCQLAVPNNLKRNTLKL